MKSYAPDGDTHIAESLFVCFLGFNISQPRLIPDSEFWTQAWEVFVPEPREGLGDLSAFQESFMFPS